MAFDAELADRIRKALGTQSGIVDKKMFGGIAFLLNGHMCCGVHGRALIVRLDPDRTARAMLEPHVSAFDPTGRPMKGWILVQPEGVATKGALAKWVGAGVQYAASLTSK